MPRRSGLSPEAFVKLWQDSASLADVAEQAGLTPRAATIRASNLRRIGVPLKLFTASTIDVGKLAALALRRAPRR